MRSSLYTAHNRAVTNYLSRLTAHIFLEENAKNHHART